MNRTDAETHAAIIVTEIVRLLEERDGQRPTMPEVVSASGQDDITDEILTAMAEGWIDTTVTDRGIEVGRTV